MVPQIKRILYATDLSENAKHAFTYAATIANKFDAKITVLHVLEAIPSNTEWQIVEYLGVDGWKEVQKNKKQEVIDNIKKNLNNFCEEMYSSFKSCPFLVDEMIIKEGVPVDEILKAVDSKNCDMVVMGTHGYGLLADALIGSNARRVVRRCKKPVMVVRLPK
ncbi:MAG: universal stress protein [Desulfobacterales bacterium]|nr:universal stress protein [Desulfobacterales bacterium]